MPEINAFLRQGTQEKVKFEDCVHRLKSLCQ
jgi:flagellar biosynthesis/type III secretory pathway ATPase